MARIELLAEARSEEIKSEEQVFYLWKDFHIKPEEYLSIDVHCEKVNEFEEKIKKEITNADVRVQWFGFSTGFRGGVMKLNRRILMILSLNSMKQETENLWDGIYEHNPGYFMISRADSFKLLQVAPKSKSISIFEILFSFNYFSFF